MISVRFKHDAAALIINHQSRLYSTVVIGIGRSAGFHSPTERRAPSASQPSADETTQASKQASGVEPYRFDPAAFRPVISGWHGMPRAIWRLGKAEPQQPKGATMFKYDTIDHAPTPFDYEATERDALLEFVEIAEETAMSELAAFGNYGYFAECVPETTAEFGAYWNHDKETADIVWNGDEGCHNGIKYRRDYAFVW